MSILRILFVEPQPVMQLGYSSLVSTSPVTPLFAANSAEAVKTAKKHVGHLAAAVIEAHLPDEPGTSLMLRLRELQPNLPCLILTGVTNPVHGGRALALGANGYRTKDLSAKQTLEAILRVAKGEDIWDRASRRSIMAGITVRRAHVKQEVSLTAREGEVLRHVAAGLSNKEIAAVLHISYETVKEHVQHIMRKVGAEDRTQAAVWAIGTGWLSYDELQPLRREPVAV